MAESLSQFIERERANLDNCALEALHLAGAVQADGALIALAADGTIIACSENIATLLNFPTVAETLGQPLSSLHAGLADELSQLAATEPGTHIPLAARVESAELRFDVVYHHFNDIGYLEFVPYSRADEHELMSRLRQARRAAARITRAADFDVALTVFVEAVREITGFARVKIYQFMPDWSGRVVAEARAEHMPSYLGLFFPATDIPEQARELYYRLPCRDIAAVDDRVSPIQVVAGLEHLDLTYSLLRAVSTLHTAYLRNIGVASSLSVGLKLDGKLWGLLACHHDEQGLLAYDIRLMLQDLGEALMARKHQDDVVEKAVRIQQTRVIESAIARTVRETGDILKTLTGFAKELREFMKADGLAIELGSEMIREGAVPPPAYVRQIVNQLRSTDRVDEHFQSSTLALDHPGGMAFRDTACGVLLQPIRIHTNCWLVWFRGPMLDMADWAGDPNQKTFESRADGTHVLSPRNSFETWSSEHVNIALPWSEADIVAARSLFREILDLIAYQATELDQLKNAHDNLAVFTHATVHDIRSPLRTIDLALQNAREIEGGLEVDDPDEIEFRKTVSKAAETSVQRLGNLIDQVLAFVEITDDEMHLSPILFVDVIDDVSSLLKVPIEERAAELHYEGQGTIIGNRPLITTALQNLINNALNYSDPERLPKIRVELRDAGDDFEIVVSDNGIGIDPEYAEQIFKPFRRLHRHESIDGTGIGLATVQRILSLHGGRAFLDTSYTGTEDEPYGARFVLQFPKSGPAGARA